MKVAILDDHLSVAQSMATTLTIAFNEKAMAFSPNQFDCNVLLEFDILLLDYDFGKWGNANDILIKIDNADLIDLKIILFSSFTETQTLLLCRHHLVQGYIHKSEDTEVIIQALNNVMAGKKWYQTEQKEEIKELLSLPKSDVLTTRERDIVWLAKQGKSRETIANELHISVNTVGTHLGNIFQKLGVNSMREF